MQISIYFKPLLNRSISLGCQSGQGRSDTGWVSYMLGQKSINLNPTHIVLNQVKQVKHCHPEIFSLYLDLD